MTAARDEIFYKAMATRDRRFDGVFFIGVKTTGIYCRPICPAKPKRQNVEFFGSARAAQARGYRACLRCRPDAAPNSPAWLGKNATVQRALRLLEGHRATALGLDALADKLGVSARHVRRLFGDSVHVSPKQLIDRKRLAIAHRLISGTKLPMTEIAYAAGFGSIRRFNDAVKKHFRCTPSLLRARAKENAK